MIALEWELLAFNETSKLRLSHFWKFGQEVLKHWKSGPTFKSDYNVVNNIKCNNKDTVKYNSNLVQNDKIHRKQSCPKV